MIVYHGLTEIIKNPDVVHSKKYLDFGQGFYITTFENQEALNRLITFKRAYEVNNNGR